LDFARHTIFNANIREFWNGGVRDSLGNKALLRLGGANIVGILGRRTSRFVTKFIMAGM
jgi:hypothetical protein